MVWNYCQTITRRISVSVNVFDYFCVSGFLCFCPCLSVCLSLYFPPSLCLCSSVCIRGVCCVYLCVILLACLLCLSSCSLHVYLLIYSHTPPPIPPPPKHTTQQVFMHNLVINLPHFCNICGAAMRTQLAARKHHDAAKRRRKGVIWIT